MSVAHSASTTTLLVRVLMAFALTFVLGFERELRGSPAGDRTFSLIGTASAVLGNLAGAGSPNAIAGAVTGIGFIGGGIVFRRTVRSGQMVDGITTAAAVFATAAIGAAAGAGLLAVAALATAWSSSPWKDRTSRCSGSSMPAAGRPTSSTTRTLIGLRRPPVNDLAGGTCDTTLTRSTPSLTSQPESAIPEGAAATG